MVDKLVQDVKPDLSESLHPVSSLLIFSTLTFSPGSSIYIGSP